MCLVLRCKPAVTCCYAMTCWYQQVLCSLAEAHTSMPAATSCYSEAFKICSLGHKAIQFNVEGAPGLPSFHKIQSYPFSTKSTKHAPQLTCAVPSSRVLAAAVGAAYTTNVSEPRFAGSYQEARMPAGQVQPAAAQLVKAAGSQGCVLAVLISSHTVQSCCRCIALAACAQLQQCLLLPRPDYTLGWSYRKLSSQPDMRHTCQPWCCNADSTKRGQPSHLPVPGTRLTCCQPFGTCSLKVP